MKYEIKDKTLIVRLKYLPQGIKYINLCGIILCRYTTQIKAVDWQHEAIHSQQFYETLIVGMLVWYVGEYFVRLVMYRNHDKAYKGISFEQEAYLNESNPDYIKGRKHYYWLSYL